MDFCCFGPANAASDGNNYVRDTVAGEGGEEFDALEPCNSNTFVVKG